MEINIQVSSISTWLIKLNPTFLISLSALQRLIVTRLSQCSAGSRHSVFIVVCSAGGCRVQFEQTSDPADECLNKVVPGALAGVALEQSHRLLVPDSLHLVQGPINRTYLLTLF